MVAGIGGVRGGRPGRFGMADERRAGAGGPLDHRLIGQGRELGEPDGHQTKPSGGARAPLPPVKGGAAAATAWPECCHVSRPLAFPCHKYGLENAIVKRLTRGARAPNSGFRWLILLLFLSFRRSDSDEESFSRWRPPAVPERSARDDTITQGVPQGFGYPRSEPCTRYRPGPQTETPPSGGVSSAGDRGWAERPPDRSCFSFGQRVQARTL